MKVLNRRLFFIGATVILASCAFVGSGRECNTLPEKKQAACFQEKALRMENPQLCYRITDFEQREKCYLLLAIETCDVSLCDNLRLLYRSDGCREEVALRPECVSKILQDARTQKQKDVAPVSVPGVRQESDEEENVNDSCGPLQEEDRERCYLETALETSDVSWCDKIRGERFEHLGSNPPRDKCVMAVALEMCDPSLCDGIKGGAESFSATGCKQTISQKCP